MIWTPKLIKPLPGRQLNRSHPLSRGLVGCWVMNERCGSTVLDYSDQHNHGTLNNNASWRMGNRGPSIDITTDDYIDVGNPGYNFSDLSIVTKICVDSEPASYYLCGSNDYGNNRFDFFIYETYNRLQITYGDGTKDDASSGSLLNVVVGKWMTVACTKKGGEWSFYKDGKNIGDDSQDDRPAVTGTNLYLGGQNKGGGVADEMDGRIEYFWIYNRTLSPYEIQWLYREPFAMFESGFPKVFNCC